MKETWCPKVLKLQLVREGRVVWEIPLDDYPELPSPTVKRELDAIEDELEKLEALFDSLSNSTRLRMLLKLAREPRAEMCFSDFMKEFELNQKTVNEFLKNMREASLIDKKGRGRYALSSVGFTSFLTTILATRHVMRELEHDFFAYDLRKHLESDAEE